MTETGHEKRKSFSVVFSVVIVVAVVIVVVNMSRMAEYATCFMAALLPAEARLLFALVAVLYWKKSYLQSRIPF